MFNKDMINAHVEQKKQRETLIKQILPSIGVTEADLAKVDMKAFEDLIENCGSTRCTKIDGSDYSMYLIPPSTVRNFIQAQVAKAEGADVNGAPEINGKELAAYKYPRVRSSLNPGTVFNFDAHKAQYDRLAAFATQYVQAYFENLIGLKKIGVPEAKSVEMKGQSVNATCPIWMSKEFHWPDNN